MKIEIVRKFELDANLLIKAVQKIENREIHLLEYWLNPHLVDFNIDFNKVSSAFAPIFYRVNGGLCRSAQFIVETADIDVDRIREQHLGWLGSLKKKVSFHQFLTSDDQEYRQLAKFTRTNDPIRVTPPRREFYNLIEKRKKAKEIFGEDVKLSLYSWCSETPGERASFRWKNMNFSFECVSIPKAATAEEFETQLVGYKKKLAPFLLTPPPPNISVYFVFHKDYSRFFYNANGSRILAVLDQLQPEMFEDNSDFIEDLLPCYRYSIKIYNFIKGWISKKHFEEFYLGFSVFSISALKDRIDYEIGKTCYSQNFNNFKKTLRRKFPKGEKC